MIFWFWTLFIGAILLWYLLVTALVGYKGAQDIREILRKMKQTQNHD